MRQQQQPSGYCVPFADPTVPVSTPAVQQRTPASAVYQAITQPQMPAYIHDMTQAPRHQQQLGWDSQQDNYMSVNVTVNLPALGPYIHQVPAQTSQLVPTLIQPQHPIQAAQMQSQQLPQHHWSAGSPGPQLQPHLAGQHMQLPINQTSYHVMQRVEHRQEQLPFWHPSPATARAGAVSAGHTAAGRRPAPYAQLQQSTAGAALIQHAAPTVASPTIPVQLQPQLLQAALQPQVQLQDVLAYALVLLPPAASGTEAVPQQQLLQAQAAASSPLALQQQGQQLPVAPQQQYRKTRRGPSRGRSKQKNSQQQAETAAAAATDNKAAPKASGSQQSDKYVVPGPDQALDEARSARVTSGSSTSFTSASTKGASSGSRLSGSQGGAETAAEDQNTTGSPQKKRMRRRGRRGKKCSSQELEPVDDDSHREQEEGQTLPEPLTPPAAAGIKASTGASKSSTGSQQQPRASSSSPSGAAAAVGAGAAQPAKRTTGLSHRQRYRRKQWELHRAMEQQRAQAEVEAQQQAEAQVLLAAAQAQLATPQQLPVMWQALQGPAVISGASTPPQLQCSPVTITQHVQGSPIATGIAPAAVLQTDLQQRADMLAAAAAAVASQASASGSDSAGVAAGIRACTGAAAGAEASWGATAVAAVPLEGQVGEGLGQVDNNLDEWLSKLLEL